MLCALIEDHVGVGTVAEIDTEDETLDILTDPIFHQKHQEL